MSVAVDSGKKTSVPRKGGSRRECLEKGMGNLFLF